MAEQLDHYDFKSLIGRKDRDRWDQWLDGHIWKLSRGTDFKNTVASVAGSAHRNAKLRAGKCRTSSPDNDTLIIQFYRPNE